MCTGGSLAVAVRLWRTPPAPSSGARYAVPSSGARLQAPSSGARLPVSSSGARLQACECGLALGRTAAIPHSPNTPPGGSCSPPADFDGGGPVRMARRPVQSKIHRRLRATPARLHPSICPRREPSRVFQWRTPPRAFQWRTAPRVFQWRTPPGVRMRSRAWKDGCDPARAQHAARGIVLAAGGFRRWRPRPHGTSPGAVEDSPAAARDPRPAASLDLPSTRTFPRLPVAHASRRLPVAHASRRANAVSRLQGRLRSFTCPSEETLS